MTVAAVATAPTLSISPFQGRILDLPEDTCLALSGGKGGGKTRGAALIVLRHVGTYGAAARVLWLRQSHRGVLDAQGQLVEVFGEAFGGRGYRLNSNEGIFTLPSGASVEMNQLESLRDLGKFQGRSFTLLIIDEGTQWSTPTLLDRLRSNLRGPRGIPTRIVLLVNPGDVGHGWVAKRHAMRAPWQPYEEDWTAADGGEPRQWITAPSTYLENPFIDTAAYRRELAAACSDDPELLKAWLAGDWSVVRGSYFSDVLSDAVALDFVTPEWLAAERARVEVQPRYWLPPGDVGDLYLAHDFGSSAPSVTFVVLKVADPLHLAGRVIRSGSYILLDELATVNPDNANEGLRWTVPQLAAEIKALATRWGCRPEGVADDAIFAKARGADANSIAEEFRDAGVYFQPAGKGGRVDGWQRMRTLLNQAATPDLPGLFVSRNCKYWWETVPLLQRDARRREDVATSGPDHAADACRYALTGHHYLGLTLIPDRSLC
jgi:hypothetical protein